LNIPLLFPSFFRFRNRDKSEYDSVVSFAGLCGSEEAGEGIDEGNCSIMEEFE
jgi:hypothetical protein